MAEFVVWCFKYVATGCDFVSVDSIDYCSQSSVLA